MKKARNLDTSGRGLQAAYAIEHGKRPAGTGEALFQDGTGPPCYCWLTCWAQLGAPVSPFRKGSVVATSAGDMNIS